MRRSYWRERAMVPDMPALEGRLTADVCVVGAGIAGVSTAYLLAREGQSVVVLDRGQIGAMNTERTTAHLSNAIDDRFAYLEKVHGAEAARLAGESHTAAIDKIDAIVGLEKIDCDFARLDGFLCQAPDGPNDLDEELDAAHRAGLFDVERRERTPVAGLPGPCLRFPSQAQFHPVRYLAGLVAAAQRKGVRFFSGADVSDIEGEKELTLRTRTGASVRANAAVIATNTPIHERVAIHTKQIAYRTYVIALEVERDAVPGALYWDNLVPYHYVRVHRERGSSTDTLIVGGEDDRIGPRSESHALERYRRLEEWARKRFPGLGPVRARWSGEILEPVDGLAFIGKSPGFTSELYLATGDSGMGLTHGTIAGIMLTDLILGRESPWTELYDPSRKTLRAAAKYLRENLETAARYADWLHLDRIDLAAIAPASGAIVRQGLRELAVYRDEDGVYHAFSARCSHLGGRVGWNGDDKTWDCPCHGARYDCYGRVIQAPANADLEPVVLAQK